MIFANKHGLLHSNFDVEITSYLGQSLRLYDIFAPLKVSNYLSNLSPNINPSTFYIPPDMLSCELGLRLMIYKKLSFQPGLYLKSEVGLHRKYPYLATPQD